MTDIPKHEEFDPETETFDEETWSDLNDWNMSDDIGEITSEQNHD